MPVWVGLTLLVATSGLVGALAFVIVFAAGARIADALVAAFKKDIL